MAYGFGQGINPSLGRIDYSPIMQGALSQANSMSNAAAIQAQALGQTGAAIGGAIRQYRQKKEKKQMEERSSRALTNFFKTHPDAAKSIGVNPDDPEDIKVSAKAFGSPAEVLKFVDMATEYSNTRKQQGLSEGAAKFANELVKVGGDVTRVNPQLLASLQPEAVQMGTANATKILHMQSEAARNLADAARQPPAPKPPDLSFQEQALNARIESFVAENNRNPTAQERSAMFGDIMRANNPAGDPEAQARLSLMAKELPAIGERADVAYKLIPTISSLERKLADISAGGSGMNTGKLEPFKAELAGFARSVGIPVDVSKLANAEAAQAMFGQFMLEWYAATKGAITERENTLFASMGPQFSKVPEANKELIALIKSRVTLDARLGNLYRDGLSEGKNISEINAAIQKERRSYLESYDQKLAALESRFVEQSPSGIKPEDWAHMTEAEKQLFRKRR